MNLGMPEMIFIFFLALIIFGPRKLPEIGRQLGKAMNDFKRASNSFQAQLEDEVRNLEMEEQNARTIHALPTPTPAGTVTHDGAEVAEATNGSTEAAGDTKAFQQGRDG